MSEANVPPPAPRATAEGPDLGLIARLGAQKSKFRNAAKLLAGQRDELRAQVEKLTAENAQLKTRADSSASARRVAELEGQLRTINHRAVFDRVAKGRGVRPDALDAAYQLSGYQATGDEADEAAIGALIDEHKAASPFLFGQAGDKAAEGNAPPPKKPGPGSGQGGGDVGAPRILAPDDPRHSDVKYIFANFDKVAASAKERVERGEI